MTGERAWPVPLQTNHHRPARIDIFCILAATVLTFASSASAEASHPSANPWPNYPIIEWQKRNPAQLATLKRIGVTAAAVIADRDGTGTPLSVETAPLRKAGLRWYIENIATDFYSAYHRWTPGKPVNWRFVALQQQYSANPNDMAALIRDPSLSDPVWQARIDARLTAVVHQEQHDHPLFYNLGDETGIADLTAFWDFDFSPESLAGMRAWLHQQYPSLAALNAEWDTHFVTWNAVRPETTIEAMRRTDGNYAAWADFKAWMDVAFARALRRGTDAVHTADPHALAAIEGAQVPGWGGYNYTHLAHAVDVMEIYDGDENLPIVHSLNPHLITLTTSFGGAPANIFEIWRALLRGSRGLILWEQNDNIVRPDGALGPRGITYAHLFPQLRRIAPLLAAATWHTDPVAILYSPASFRTQWMLDQQPKGEAWIERGSEKETEDDAFRIAMRGDVQSLSFLGLQPHFVSAAMLPGLRDKVLILPDTLALSPADANAIAAFAKHGGMVIADRQPGIFDAHSRRLPQPDLPPGIAHLIAPDDHAALSTLLAKAGVVASFHVSAPADIAMYRFDRGSRTILALQRRSPGRETQSVGLTLPRRMTLTDLRTGRSLGTSQMLAVSVGPIEPTILSAH